MAPSNSFLGAGAGAGAGEEDGLAENAPSAEAVLRRLAPACAPTVLGRLRRERIRTALDLAGLDKDDLRELGLSMLERSRVLVWSRQACHVSDHAWLESEAIKLPERSESGWSIGADFRRSTSRSGTIEMETIEAKVGLLDAGTPGSTVAGAEQAKIAGEGAGGGLSRRPSGTFGRSLSVSSCADFDFARDGEKEETVQRRLDDVEQRTDFWCALIATAPKGDTQMRNLTGSRLQQCAEKEFSDVRETVLEDLFDLTEERVAEIYGQMCGSSEDRASIAQLAVGLQRCGLPAFDDAALVKVLDAVTGGQQSQGVHLAEFETVLTRLKLAQLLVGVDGEVGCQIVAVDYNAHGATVVRPRGVRPLRQFFFGHRPQPKIGDTSLGQANLVRWINLRGMNMTLLLALMVKYGLHPLGVEDVIEECQTKMDCYGGHYFAAVEQLSLASRADGSPVSVRGCHTSVFCSGPPLFDTVITVTQEDRSFAEDWPRDEALASHQSPVEEGQDDPWVERLRSRLTSARSRLRERRADYLMHQVIDLTTDELVHVVKAYQLRLGSIEQVVRRRRDTVAAYLAEPDWLREVTLIGLQLSVVARRVRGLLRVLRHVVEDRDLAVGLASYLQDVKDHLDEAQEDTAHLREKCEAMTEAYERTMEREQELGRERAAKRLNTTLFVLTVATAIFAPVQFLAGVYGMNFVNSDGKPTIPELTWANGYEIFWCAVIVYLLSAVSCASCYFYRMRRKAREEFAPIELAREQLGCLTNSDGKLDSPRLRGRGGKEGPGKARAGSAASERAASERPGSGRYLLDVVLPRRSNALEVPLLRTEEYRSPRQPAARSWDAELI